MKINYTVEYKKIKNFILRIYPDGKVKISVPMIASKKNINDFLESKSKWLEKHLKKFENKFSETKCNSIRILGKVYKIKKQKVLNKIEEKILIDEDVLYIYYYDESNITKNINDYMNRLLNQLLEQSIKKYEDILNKSVDNFYIKKVKSFWGAYHSKKNYITFNINLIECDAEFIDYVVLHEMCHMFHMNHQKQFWLMIEKYQPKYKEIIKRNKQYYF